MRTFKQHILILAQHCGNENNPPILGEKILSEVEPYIVNALNENAKEIGYDGYTWERDYLEYPLVLYNCLWLIIKKVVLDFLQKTYPQAWFLPIYKQ